jgi:hypothetical protein
MEALLVIITNHVEVERTELANEKIMKEEGLNFRRRLSEVVCKSSYAALDGSFLCGER